jgi:NAD-dependent dihydropyrimidine dehydrogenase PreA subunit
MMLREIVLIDEDKCDGCGQCVPACQEGAIQIIDGKAKLVADRLCDGMGACLGHCPRGAIRIERRQAGAFDEAAVHALTISKLGVVEPRPTPAHHGGCPGSRFQQFAAPAEATARDNDAEPASHSRHWPVQLSLLNPQAPVLQNAKLLVAADCVPVAYAGFHDKLLRNRAVVIGCPKFDDLQSYTARLAAMIQANDLQEIVVARMQVPCCQGILQAVLQAKHTTRSNVPVREIIISIEGKVLLDRPMDEAAMML